MGDIVTPANVAADTEPNFKGPSVSRPKEWWDGWLTGTQIINGYKVIRTDKEPCPQASGPDAPPAGEKITETRQNIATTILTYTVSRYTLETSIWWYIGAAAVLLGVGAALVGTAGLGTPALIAAATAKGLIAAGATLATLGSGLVSVVGSSKRGSYIGPTTTTETKDPVDVGNPYTVVTKPCR